MLNIRLLFQQSRRILRRLLRLLQLCHSLRQSF
jgi:hypothetical protein